MGIVTGDLDYSVREEVRADYSVRKLFRDYSVGKVKGGNTLMEVTRDYSVRKVMGDYNVSDYKLRVCMGDYTAWVGLEMAG